MTSLGDCLHAALAVVEDRHDRYGDARIVMRDIAADWTPRMLDKGMDFGFETNAVAVVTGNAFLLREMFNNLLDNALKFTPQGGLVTLSLRPGPELRVSDSGPGVPDEWKTRIFQRFERANTDTRGHGLGLPLSLAIARRHGLTIRVLDNEPGAIFVVGRGGEGDA